MYVDYLDVKRFNEESLVINLRVAVDFQQVPSCLFDEMPCIWLKPSKKEEDDGSAATIYNCPLYKTSLRVSACGEGWSSRRLYPLTTQQLASFSNKNKRPAYILLSRLISPLFM